MKPKATFRGVVIKQSSTLPAGKTHARPQTLAPVVTGEQKIRVSREVSGRGGKGVTVISGLALPAAELETLAGELKRACGAGGALREGRIEIQGEHRDRLVAELIKRGHAAKRAGG
jgi:predicted translation initiation factor SUI1